MLFQCVQTGLRLLNYVNKLQKVLGTTVHWARVAELEVQRDGEMQSPEILQKPPLPSKDLLSASVTANTVSSRTAGVDHAWCTAAKLVHPKFCQVCVSSCRCTSAVRSHVRSTRSPQSLLVESDVCLTFFSKCLVIDSLSSTAVPLSARVLPVGMFLKAISFSSHRSLNPQITQIQMPHLTNSLSANNPKWPHSRPLAVLPRLELLLASFSMIWDAVDVASRQQRHITSGTSMTWKNHAHHWRKGKPLSSSRALHFGLDRVDRMCR